MPSTKLILGDLPALEDALAGEIAAARAGDPLAPVTVLTGHALLRPYLRRTLARRGVPLINVRFARADELAQTMSKDAGDVDARPWLAPAVERLLVREIAEGAGGYFAAIAGRDGFAEALGGLFRELERGGFSPDAFERALGRESPDEVGKFGQLARLYEAHRARRENFSSVADHIARALNAPFEGPLLVYGVWQPDEVQARLIEAIAARAPVTVLLPESSLDADEAHAAFRERLLASGVQVERAPAPRGGGLATRLFRSAPSSGNGTAPAAPDVTLVSAPDTVREAWEAARTCLGWAREGIRFHEMAVVYRNRDPYRDLVDEIFSEAGIATYLHDGRLLSTHPLGRRVLRLLDLAATHETFARAKVMEFLTETELPRETIDRHGRVRPSEWETFTREAGVVEGAEQWQARLQRLADEKREESRNENYDWLADIAERIETLMRFSAELHAALAARPEEATWDEHLDYLRGLAETYAAGTAPVIEALEDLRALAAVREHASFDVFCRAVRDDLESRDTSRVLNEPVRLFGRQGVAVIDARLRHLRFRAVYMLGVAERAWPPPQRPDPLLLEHERRAINDAGQGVLPLRTEPDDEPLTFWLAAQSASEHFALSYARAAAGRSGKHLPSYFFRAVVEALEGRRLTLDEVDASPHVRRIEAGRLASPRLDASLSEAEYDRGLIKLANAGAAPAAIDAIAAVSPVFGRAVEARRERWSQALTPYDGVMTSTDGAAAAAGASAFAQGRAVSASRMETYAACPYRYFMRYTLRIEPIEEPESIERMDHLQRGSLIHEILQTFLTRIGRDDPPSAARRAEHLPLLLQISCEAGEERERRGVTGRPLLWAMDRRAIDEDLVRWYDEEVKEIERGGPLPGAFEARFGPANYGLGEEDKAFSTDDPLLIEADGREIALQGRIDRIDWDSGRTRFRVIDYKTGRRYARGVLERGEALQLPIYLHAAARMVGLDPAQGEAQYFYVSSRGGYKRHNIDGALLEERAKQFEQVVSTIAGGVDGGFFAPNPLHDHCRWCDYKDVCDVRIGRIMERKTGDERGQEYRALQEIE